VSEGRELTDLPPYSPYHSFLFHEPFFENLSERMPPNHAEANVINNIQCEPSLSLMTVGAFIVGVCLKCSLDTRASLVFINANLILRILNQGVVLAFKDSAKLVFVRLANNFLKTSSKIVY